MHRNMALSNLLKLLKNNLRIFYFSLRLFDKHRTFTLGRTRGSGGGGGAWMPPLLKVFVSIFLGDKTSAPDVFSSCSFIPRAHFETSLVMISCYGYEI